MSNENNKEVNSWKNKKIEELLLELKKDSRFNLLDDDTIAGFGDGVEYDIYNELESNNLKIYYYQYICGSKLSDEIVVTDKRKNVHVFYNLIFEFYRLPKIPIIKTDFTIDELRDYIDKNA